MCFVRLQGGTIIDDVERGPRSSLQSMVDLDKILGAPTVPHLRCGAQKTVQIS